MSVFGVVFGTVAGRSLRFDSQGHAALFEDLDTVTFDYITKCVIRMIIGGIFLIMTKLIVKVFF